MECKAREGGMEGEREGGIEVLTFPKLTWRTQVANEESDPTYIFLVT